MDKRTRPKSLEEQDNMQSASDDTESDEDGAYGGLSAASCHLGVGAVLYLQILKTFAILFLVLSIINIPIYITYA